MELKEFSDEFKRLANIAEIDINDYQIKKFYEYMLLIQEWNEKINLTAIIEPKEMIIKHFIDSLTIIKEVKDNSKVIDIGTGAGFPGIPLKIYNDSIKITLLDSLKKRTIFLNTVIEKLELKDVEIIHGRAEDFAQNVKYRESYDFAVSRAVAPLNVLLEYLVPCIKIKGSVIAMKGSNALEEVENAKKALKELKSTIKGTERKSLPEDNGERYNIIVQKVEKTAKKYPRKAGIPKKSPL